MKFFAKVSKKGREIDLKSQISDLRSQKYRIRKHFGLSNAPGTGMLLFTLLRTGRTVSYAIGVIEPRSQSRDSRSWKKVELVF